MLRFNAARKFKILQLTDIHWKMGSTQNKRISSLIHSILSVEKPDLVVLTGDFVHSTHETKEACREVTTPMIQRGIPWAAVIGNHDDEGDLSRLDLMNCLESLPLSLTQKGPAELGGTGNYRLAVHLQESDEVGAWLYFLDSFSNSPLQSRGIGGYAWITHEQIAWFRSLHASTETT
ncbi:MAG: metallophosphoesterase, partial [Verrucomicrobiota bacterium]